MKYRKTIKAYMNRYFHKQAFSTFGVFRGLLISYFTLIVIMSTAIAVLYSFMVHTVETQIKENYLHSLFMAEERVNTLHQSILSTITQIQFNNNVKTLGNRPSPWLDEQVFETLNLMKDLKIYDTATSHYQNMYIHFNNGRCLVSKSGKEVMLDSYFTRTYDQVEQGYSKWLKMFETEHSVYNQPMEIQHVAYSDKNVFRYVQTLYDYTKSTIIGTAVIDVDERSIQNMLQETLSSDNSSAMIFDENKVPLTSVNDPKNKFNVNELLKTHETSAFSDSITVKTETGEKAVLSYVNSYKTGWKYVALIPYQAFVSQVNSVYYTIGVVFLFALLAGIILSYCFAKGYYRPIEHLLSLFHHSPQKKENEFSVLANSVSRVVKENSAFLSQLDISKNEMQNHLFNNLILGKFKKLNLAQNYLHQHQMDSPNMTFLVIAFEIDDYLGFYHGDNLPTPKTAKNTIHFLLQNIFLELFSEDFTCLTGTVDEHTICLVGFVGDSGQRVMRLLSIINEAKQLIAREFSVYFSTSISDMHQQTTHIPTAYEEACKALEYKFLLGSNEIILYDEIKERNCQEEKKCNYFWEERLFCNKLATGDYTNARKTLNNLLYRHFLESNLSIQTIQLRKYGLVSHFVGIYQDIMATKHCAEIHSNDLFESIGNNLISHETVDDLKIQMMHYIDQLEALIQPVSTTNSFEENVIQYVQNHYSDPNLNVSSIASHFGVTVVKLSKTFKSFCDVGLLHYINKLRIESAKNHLINTSACIREISEKVGFVNDAAMIRVFKTYEGITPGRYREIHENAKILLPFNQYY